MAGSRSEPRPSGYADEVIGMDVGALEVLAAQDVDCKLRLAYALELLYLRARLREISRLAVDGLDPEVQPPKGPRVRRVK